MQRRLLIPYALNMETGERISADYIAALQADARSTLRLQATARHDTHERKKKSFRCPACYKSIYPHAPITRGGRYYWSHRAGKATPCPLERKASLTPDDIRRLIFAGRQEGEAHRELVALIHRMAERDSDTEAGSVAIGAYEPPSPEMRGEFPHGRFPDVRFVYKGNRIVVEAQLATIALDAINGRRAFYDRNGQSLLWVTRGFEPRLMRASIRDILADQKGMLFSIDRDVLNLHECDGRFRLRAWEYDFTVEEGETWRSEILTLDEIIAHSPVRVWSSQFKTKWMTIFADQSFHTVSHNTLRSLYLEIIDACQLESSDGQDDVWHTLHIVNLLICLESSRLLGTRHEKLVSLVHSTLDSQPRQHAANLISRALSFWQPALAADEKVTAKIERLSKSVKQSGRKSPIGLIREKLFPNWILPVSQTVCTEKVIG